MNRVLLNLHVLTYQDIYKLIYVGISAIHCVLRCMANAYNSSYNDMHIMLCICQDNISVVFLVDAMHLLINQRNTMGDCW